MPQSLHHIRTRVIVLRAVILLSLPGAIMTIYSLSH